MKPRRCPRCGLTNPRSAVWCDCGYIFDPVDARRLGREECADEEARSGRLILICRICGLINPPDSERCDCGHRLAVRPRTAAPTEPRTVRGITSCPSCSAKLRLKPSVVRREYSCPHCACRFAVTEGSSSEISLRILFDPRHLTRCFETLGATQGCTLEELRAAYRKRVCEYHPDKVATLGAELQALAEQKTKEINEAYRTILDHQSRTSRS